MGNLWGEFVVFSSAIKNRWLNSSYKDPLYIFWPVSLFVMFLTLLSIIIYPKILVLALKECCHPCCNMHIDEKVCIVCNIYAKILIFEIENYRSYLGIGHVHGLR